MLKVSRRSELTQANPPPEGLISKVKLIRSASLDPRTHGHVGILSVMMFDCSDWDTHLCEYKQRTIAQRCHTSYKTISRAWKAFEVAGIARFEHRFRRSSVVYFNWPKPDKNVHERTDLSDQTGQICPGRLDKNVHALSSFSSLQEISSRERESAGADTRTPGGAS